MTLVQLDDIRTAAKRVDGQVTRTPLIACAWTDAPWWLKPECLQPTGAFKIRGAINAVAALPAADRAKGVVAYSSGNHGRAVAWAAREYRVPAVIVMPDTTPPVKLEGVTALGAEVVVVAAEDREVVADRVRSERGMAVIPPFDHCDVIAGQGTVGLEIVEDLPEVDTVLVPIGGGGLVSGVAVALKELRPHARVVGVEPELAGDLAEGFRSGQRVSWDYERTGRTMADGLRAPAVGQLAWKHISTLVDDVVTVSEQDIRAAMTWLATGARLVAEPSGAVALAGAMSRPEIAVGCTAIVVSGGNLPPELLADVLMEGSTA